MADDRKTPPEGQIRSLDPFRDLSAVVDLISVAFGDRMDPAGEATLARMRRLARGGPLLQWVWAFLGKATVAPGLVWVVDGRPVGNVSVRRARGYQGYLIGNVVVHPAHRGQGIASALMRHAIRAISRRGARWVGLEVRADNEVARGLYDRLGFVEVGRTCHLLLEISAQRAVHPPRLDALRRARAQDGDALIRLVRDVVPEPQRPLLEVNEADYRPGWGRRIEHWLRGEDEDWWVVDEEAEIAAAVRTVRRRGAFPHRMEILVRPRGTGRFERALARRGIATLGRGARKPIEISLPDPRDPVVAVLKDEGFRELRVLVQMKRVLAHKVAVSVN